jgi:hypothetical protein
MPIDHFNFTARSGFDETGADSGTTGRRGQAEAAVALQAPDNEKSPDFSGL